MKNNKIRMILNIIIYLLITVPWYRQLHAYRNHKVKIKNLNFQLNQKDSFSHQRSNANKQSFFLKN